MSLKQQVENHPLYFIGGVIFAAASAGWAGHANFGRSSSVATCSIQGVGQLSEQHGQRLSTLQEGLIRMEAKASDDALIPSFQAKYAESADHLRKDIADEQKAFVEQLATLRKACS